MKIDAFPHILPRKLYQRMFDHAGGEALNMKKRTAGIPMLWDLDERFRVMDLFGPEYRQILTIASPPIETLGEPAVTRELAKLANEEMAELCARYPERFSGFAASLPLNDPEASVREAERATKQLGALGVQIFTNVLGHPLDEPQFAGLFDAMAELDRPIWCHPARAAGHPDYVSEDRSRYELWWVFGWPYETALFMSRIIFSGVLDTHPRLRILTHHGGGMVPHFAGRIGPGLDQLGARTPDEDLVAVRRGMAKRPYDYYRMFYGDTALFGAEHALRCAIEFFGVDHMLFGSDSPFDPEKGPQFIRETIANIEAIDLTAAERAAIYEGNALRVLGIAST